MSALKTLKNLVMGGDREVYANKVFQIPVGDPVGDIIKEGGHAPPSLIEQHRGEHTVRPYIIADAIFYLSPRRRTGEPEILHPMNTQIRPAVWDLGYSNDVSSETDAFLYHDGSERENLGANFAALRLLGNPPAASQNIEWVLAALTNHRGTIKKQVEEYRTAEEIRRRLKYLENIAGTRQHQTFAYQGIKESVDAYRRDLNKEDNPFGWPDGDRARANQILDEFVLRIDELSSKPISSRDLRTETGRYFRDFDRYIQYIQDNGLTPLSPDCRRQTGEPHVVHVLDHMQYSGSPNGLFNPDWTYREGVQGGSYLEDLVIASIEALRTGQPLAHLPIKGKLEENADNLRKDVTKHEGDQHGAYTTAWSIGVVGGLFFPFLKEVQHPHTYRFFLAWKYHEAELFRRVIMDYAQNLAESDTDRNQHRPWLVRQFRAIRVHVGTEIEKYLLAQLVREGSSPHEETRDTAETLSKAYQKLTGNGKSLRGSRFSTLFW